LPTSWMGERPFHPVSRPGRRPIEEGERGYRRAASLPRAVPRLFRAGASEGHPVRSQPLSGQGSVPDGDEAAARVTRWVCRQTARLSRGVSVSAPSCCCRVEQVIHRSLACRTKIIGKDDPGVGEKRSASEGPGPAILRVPNGTARKCSEGHLGVNLNHLVVRADEGIHLQDLLSEGEALLGQSMPGYSPMVCGRGGVIGSLQHGSGGNQEHGKRRTPTNARASPSAGRSPSCGIPIGMSTPIASACETT
jgi:hypothetical protein